MIFFGLFQRFLINIVFKELLKLIRRSNVIICIKIDTKVDGLFKRTFRIIKHIFNITYFLSWSRLTSFSYSLNQSDNNRISRKLSMWLASSFNSWISILFIIDLITLVDIIKVTCKPIFKELNRILISRILFNHLWKYTNIPLFLLQCELMSPFDGSQKSSKSINCSISSPISIRTHFIISILNSCHINRIHLRITHKSISRV